MYVSDITLYLFCMQTSTSGKLYFRVTHLCIWPCVYVCNFSSAKVSSGMKLPSVATSVGELPSAHWPSSVILVTASISSIPATSSVDVTMSTSVSTGADRVATAEQPSAKVRRTEEPSASVAGVERLPTAEQPSVDVSIVDVDSSQDVAMTSSTTSAGGTSSLLAGLSYAQPSIELLRRRRDADTATISDTTTVTMSTAGSTHLLSSATQAALAALASTPRRYI